MYCVLGTQVSQRSMVLENGKAAENLWQLNILFLSGEEGLWAASFGQGQSSPKPSTPGPAVGSPPPAVSFTCAGWIWAAVPILDKVGDNTPVSTIFFFFNFQPQYCHFLPFTLSKKKKNCNV